MKRFEITEKNLFIESIVKNGWWRGDSSSLSPFGVAYYLKRKVYNSPEKTLIQESLLYLKKTTSINYQVAPSEKQHSDFRNKLLPAYQLKPGIDTVLESLIFLNYSMNRIHIYRRTCGRFIHSPTEQD